MNFIRERFKEIFEKEKPMKIIITARALGKSFNKGIHILEQLLENNNQNYTAVWLRRNLGDILDSVLPWWKSLIDWYIKKKWEDEGKRLFEEDFYLIERGISYKFKRKIFFYELARPEKARGAFTDNVDEIVFDEAIPENGRFLENEEQLFAEFLNSAYRNDENQAPTIYFLGNPYSKSAWFLKKIKGNFEELMGNEEKIWEDDKTFFYNSGNRDNRELINEFESKYDERSGLFPENADKWIIKELPKKYEILFLLKKKNMFCRTYSKKKKQEEYFFRRVLNNEKNRKDWKYIALENEEWSNSEFEKTIKAKKRFWQNALLNLLVYKKLTFRGEDAHDAKSSILSFIYGEKERSY